MTDQCVAFVARLGAKAPWAKAFLASGSESNLSRSDHRCSLRCSVHDELSGVAFLEEEAKGSLWDFVFWKDGPLLLHLQ